MTAAKGQKRILPILVFALFVIQPFLDVAGYWQQELGLPSVGTLGIRMVILAGSVIGGFFLSKNKRAYIAMALILSALTALHAIACLHMAAGYREPVVDLVNLMRIYSLPLMTISLISFLRRSRDVFPALLKSMTSVLFIDAAVMLISVLTGTDPHTYNFTRYDTASYGVLGWFLWTNSQSAILSMLCPISICYVSRRYPERLLPTGLVTGVGEAALFFLAPRLAFASMAAGGVLVAVGLWLSGKIDPEREEIIETGGIRIAPVISGTRTAPTIAEARRKQAAVVLGITILFVLCYPLSPTSRRLTYFDLEREGISGEAAGLGLLNETSKTPATVTEGATDDITWDDRLEELYRSQSMLQSAIERFGRDRVFEAYGYTTDPDILRQMRTKKIVFCRLLMEDAGPLGRLFGLNLKDMTFDRIGEDRQWTTDNFDVENDFHGIYFLTGSVGLALMLAFLGAFVLRALHAVCRRARQCLTPIMISLGGAFGLAMIHAYFTVSILRRNNASIYLAAILACLWVLSDGEKAKERSPWI